MWRGREKMKEVWKALQDAIGYHFRNPELLTQAMTHSSYANEHGSDRLASNERLEFLGDAVLELASSEFLYENYMEDPEGDMSKLRASIVCEPTLAAVARKIGIRESLLLGKGEEATGGRNRDSLTSDALEAMIGAIYIDSGYEEARVFIWEFIMSDLENRKLFYDSKTILQEMVQEKGEDEFSYAIIDESGPDHDKTFTAQVQIHGKVYGQGVGHSKKTAEQSAAFQAILKLRQEK